MRKEILIILFIFLVKNIFAIEFTNITSYEQLYVSMGNADDDVSIITIGGALFPNHFGIDKEGNSYIDDAYNSKRSGILLFNTNGQFIRRISIKGQPHEIAKLLLDEKDNVYFSNPTNILKIKEDDTFEKILSISNWKIEPYLRDFIIVNDDNDIIIQDKDNTYKSVIMKEENPEEKMLQLSKSLGLSKQLDQSVTNRVYITQNGTIISDRIERMKDVRKKINELKAKNENSKAIGSEDDFIPFHYDVPELNYFGMDKEGNTYWSYKERKKYIATVFSYNQDGKCLVKFNTVDNEVTKPIYLTLFVDCWGNVYSMQVWKNDGLKIYKYDRKW